MITKKQEKVMREIARMRKECTDTELHDAYMENCSLLHQHIQVKENTGNKAQRFGIIIQPDGCNLSELRHDTFFSDEDEFYNAVDQFDGKEFIVVPPMNDGKPTCGMKPFVWRGSLGEFKQDWSVD